MDVIPPDSAAAPARTAQTAAAARDRTGQDFDMYLKMLTTQLENQDPLNPLDPSDYAAQLAQFSAVEQQIQTNALLEAMADRLGLSEIADLAGWVGRDARAAVPAWFDGAPVTLHPQPAAVADEVWLIVRDAAGREVDRRAIPPVAEPIDWAGVSPGGAPMPSGLYSFEVESRAKGALVASSAPEVYARVDEVRRGADGPVVVLRGDVTVPAAEVTALRGR